MARSLFRRRASMPGQPASVSMAAAISPARHCLPACEAIAQARMCRSSEARGRLSRTARAPSGSLADSASRPIFSVVRSSECALLSPGSVPGCDGMASVARGSRIRLIAPAACGSERAHRTSAPDCPNAATDARLSTAPATAKRIDRFGGVTSLDPLSEQEYKLVPAIGTVRRYNEDGIKALPTSGLDNNRSH